MENNRAKVILSSKKAVGPIVKVIIFGCIVWPFILGVLVAGAVFILIPILGVFISAILEIVSLAIFVFSVIGVIKDFLSYVEVTDMGVRGKAGFKAFDLPYSQIDGIGDGKRVVNIVSKTPQNPKKPEKGNVYYWVEPVKNYKEITVEANKWLNKYNASQENEQID